VTHTYTHNGTCAAANDRRGPQSYLKEWEKARKLGHSKARELAKDLGVSLPWCWDKPRTREGYYRLQNGIPVSIGTFCIITVLFNF
jgi:isocitrate lyase